MTQPGVTEMLAISVHSLTGLASLAGRMRDRSVSAEMAHGARATSYQSNLSAFEIPEELSNCGLNKSYHTYRDPR